ncbi:hypothetical protein [Halovivax limisalsi]|uniref:hypothetical protein n=1 Tax=Halovivax limisalsi TaxID=1453760 RepID=UPI001FFD0332|nr:hypothetical protein [Halovivax limisalsi]
MVLVADTSALVSLAIADEGTPLRLLFREYDVRIPPAVERELEEIAGYDDAHASAATRALDQLDETHVQDPDTHPSYPLDDGETAAIALANDTTAAAFLCDEYHELSTVHALLSESRLLTSPKLLEVFTLRGVLSTDDANDCLAEMADLRSWRGNPYVEQFRERFGT